MLTCLQEAYWLILADMRPITRQNPEAGRASCRWDKYPGCPSHLQDAHPASEIRPSYAKGASKCQRPISFGGRLNPAYFFSA